MTILHSIIGSRYALRRVTAESRWPAGSRHTTDDILIDGDSLAQRATTGPTPLVHIAEAVGSREAHGRQKFITVVVARVEHVDHLGVLQRPDVWIDAALEGCDPIPDAARVIGRAASSRRSHLRVLAECTPGSSLTATLPADVRAGDLVAIPCVGTIPRARVARPAARRPAQVSPDGDDA